MMNAKTALAAELIAALLIILFVYTGLSKLFDHQGFRMVLSQSPLIGFKARVISKLVPVVELITALLLAIPTSRKWGLISSLLLLSIFTCYIAYLMLFESDLPCSCGGVIKNMTWKQHLLFNISFMVLGGYALGLHRGNNFFIAISRRSRKPVETSRHTFKQ